MNESDPSADSAPSVLSYRVATGEHHGDVLVRIAVLCGAIPLTAGVLIFLLWIPTRWAALGFMGFLTLLGGFFMFFCGIVCLVVYGAMERRRARALQVLSRRVGWLPWLLLLANFPIAVVVLLGVGYLGNVITFTIVNTGAVTVDEFQLQFEERTKSVGPIRPGSSPRCPSIYPMEER